MNLFIWLGIFVVSLYILVKSADKFTEFAERIGLKLGMSPFVVGLTIIAIGTSLPELISSIMAVLSGSSDMVIGNVLGSNIANICLILGIGAILIKKGKIEHDLRSIDLPFLIISIFLLGIFMLDGKITMLEGIFSLIGIIIFILYMKSNIKDATKKEIAKGVLIQKDGSSLLKLGIGLIVSSAFIFLGAKYTIDSAIQLSSLLNIGKSIISASAIAIGTSLPELSVTISLVKKKNITGAVGNVLGSNIFNTLGVIGISSLLGTLIVNEFMLIFVLPITLIATFMFYIITNDQKISKWEGALLLLFYLVFMTKLFTGI